MKFISFFSKDDVIRIWAYVKDRATFHCCATAEGHTGDVAAIAFSKSDDNAIVFILYDNL